jgi:type IV secretory pathway VirD2 relaxase
MARRNRTKGRSIISGEHAFRPGGKAPRIGWQNEGILWSGAFRKLMTVMRDTGKRRRTRKAKSQRDRIFHQRVAVRVRYSKRARPGQWKAHGHYIQRESATAGQTGFDAGPDPVKPSERLNQWQEAGDELLWKIIISPGRGDELDLEQLTKDLLAQMDNDLGLRMEWMAVVHKNTHHHHVHLVIRGVDRDGKEVKLPRDYVKQGIRQRAQELATAKLGHRLDYDVILAQMKMVQQPRFTDLDRAILNRFTGGAVYINPSLSAGLRQATETCCVDRLAYLASIGLSHQTGEHTWTVDAGMEKALRALADAHDRQRIMDQFGVMASDPATPVHITAWRDIDRLEGRILVHGQEDNREPAYLLIEDVNGVIRFMEHRREIEQARAAGRLQPGSYVAMRVKFIRRRPHWIVDDFGPAEEALNNPDFLKKCSYRGVNPPEHHLGGWLGKFRDAIRAARNARTQAHTQGQSRRG